MKSPNDIAKWIIVALAFLGMAYNVILTRAVNQNDLKHLALQFEKFEQKVDKRFDESDKKFEKLYDYLMKR
jgi:hypothetical protein